jgi:hypothetical protein
LNRVIFFLLCGVLVTGCSKPAAKRTFSESDLMPPESRQAAGVQIPGAKEVGRQVVPLPPGADHSPGAPMPAEPPSGSFSGLSAAGSSEEKTSVQEKKEKEPEGRKNPFLRESEEDIFKSTQDRLLITGLNLSAVFYSPGASAAIIDGQFYKEGDTVDNKRIVTISAEEVVLKDAQSVYVLRLKGILD